MRDANDFTIIPTLDLKDGIAVHAVAGERADYLPVVTALVSVHATEQPAVRCCTSAA